jgi:hypothetical protein
VDRRSVLRLLAAIAFAAIVIGSIEPFYLRIFFADGEHMRQSMTELPYRKLPGFRRFITGVDAHTPPGARIAIWIPYAGWDGGYGYGYYRAPFFLTGKQVVPLQVPFVDKPAPENVALADYVAAWHGAPAISGFVPIWSDEDGVLLGRAGLRPAGPAASHRRTEVSK